MTRLVVRIAVLGFLLAATACGAGGGNSSPGKRIKLADLSIWGDYGRGTESRFRGTCPPGRLTIDFRFRDELTIQSRTRLVATLNDRDAFIGCPDARVEKPRPHQGEPYIVTQVVRVKNSIKLVCVTAKRIEIRVGAAYKFHDTFAGGHMTVSTPRSPHQRRGRLLVSASFTDDGQSSFTYHAPRCRITGRA